MQGQLRVAVIGSQTCNADSPLAYTIYRTAVNYNGLCYQRLIRYRHFKNFAQKLKLVPQAQRISVKLPPKIWWSRKASLQPETVEQRQVLLNEFMQQVCTRPLTPKSEERLLKLLQVGDFAPEEDEGRVINSLCYKQEKISQSERTSEIVEHNTSLQTSVEEETSNQTDDKRSSNSRTDEDEGVQDAKRLNGRNLLTDEEDMKDAKMNGGRDYLREDSEASTNPASEDLENRDRSLSAPMAPPLQMTAKPVSISMNTQQMKRVLFESGEGGRDSTGSSSDYVSTPERHYLGQIKKCISSIEDVMESSRNLELRIREKQTNRPTAAMNA